MEPFKIKVVEPISQNSREGRLTILKECDFNLFNIQAKDVIIDLFTDSGCGAISQHQWSALMRGDESYLHASSYTRLSNAVKEMTGYKFVIPAHQGRGAEIILANTLIDQKTTIFSNGFFITTRCSFSSNNTELVDLPVDTSLKDNYLFGGNINIDALESHLSRTEDSKKIVIMTVTSQTIGGQPVSMDNLKKVNALCKKYGVFMLLDACRYAENAWLIHIREDSYADKSPSVIVREMFQYSDGCFVSCKKDGLSNCGGFVALNDENLFRKLQEHAMLSEGFYTYGGLAGRDMDAMAVGLHESIDSEYLNYRIESVKELGEILKRNGATIVEPTGGNAVLIDAEACLEHIPITGYPAIALQCALYVEGGIRTCEYGYYEHGKNNLLKRDCPRLSVPRRVYTLSHMLYVGEVVKKVLSMRKLIGEMRPIDPSMPTYFACFSPISGYLCDECNESKQTSQ